jgi:hypothetical protein
LKEVASPKRKKIKKHERDKRLKRLDKKKRGDYLPDADRNQ